MNQRIYEIWREGYDISGNSDTARLLGTASGHDFREACIAFFQQHPELCEAQQPEWGSLFDAAYLTLWGCYLFDNEQDARKAFG